MIKYVMPFERKDGLGMQLFQVMSTFVYAQMHGLTYVHRPVRHPDADESIGLGAGELNVKNVKERVKTCSWMNRYAVRWGGVLESLKEKYWSVSRTRYDLGEKSVAIHVRRGDVRCRMKRRFTSNDTIRTLQRQLSGVGKFHLFSQGNPEDFREFDDTVLHLNEDPLDTFHHLVSADILIMAKSSFSYTAALLSNGVKIYEPFFYLPLDDWVIRDTLLTSEQLETLNRRIDHGRSTRSRNSPTVGTCTYNEQH